MRDSFIFIDGKPTIKEKMDKKQLLLTYFLYPLWQLPYHNLLVDTVLFVATIWRAVFVSMPGKPDNMGLSGRILFSVSLAIQPTGGPVFGMAAW